MKVTQVRADHYERFLSTPEGVQDFFDVVYLCIPDNKGYEREITQARLQERKLNFKTVLIFVCFVEKTYLW